MYPGDIPFPNVSSAGGAVRGFRPAGRPASSGQPIVLPLPSNSSGFEFSSRLDVGVIKQVHQRTVRGGQLPPALQSKRVRVQQNLTNKAISRGWRHPRQIV